MAEYMQTSLLFLNSAIDIYRPKNSKVLLKKLCLLTGIETGETAFKLDVL